MKNCKSVQLPIVEPVYGTYHFQGGASAVIHDNPSIRNWFLNEVAVQEWFYSALQHRR